MQGDKMKTTYINKQLLGSIIVILLLLMVQVAYTEEEDNDLFDALSELYPDGTVKKEVVPQKPVAEKPKKQKKKSLDKELDKIYSDTKKNPPPKPKAPIKKSKQHKKFYNVNGELYIGYNYFINSREFSEMMKYIKKYSKEAGVSWTRAEVKALFKPEYARKIYRDKMMNVINPAQPKRRTKKIKKIYNILMSKKRQREAATVAKNYHRELKQAYRRWKVTPEDILALLNIESEFGKYRGDYEAFRIFLSEATFVAGAEKYVYKNGAYRNPDSMSRKRNLKRVKKITNRGKKNMGALIAYSKKLNIDPRVVMGSFSGAIGICQFLPYNLHYGDDGNSDGKVDLNNMTDAIFSTAKFLDKNGYSNNRERSFYRYNSNREYVRSVKDFAKLMKKRHRKLLGYY